MGKKGYKEYKGYNGYKGCTYIWYKTYKIQDTRDTRDKRYTRHTRDTGGSRDTRETANISVTRDTLKYHTGDMGYSRYMGYSRHKGIHCYKGYNNSGNKEKGFPTSIDCTHIMNQAMLLIPLAVRESPKTAFSIPSRFIIHRFARKQPEKWVSNNDFSSCTIVHFFYSLSTEKVFLDCSS